MKRLSSAGFTLIEIMIVVAVVAILGAIGYPSYLDSVRKGWRAEARTALMQEMQQQERFYTQRGKYKTPLPFKASSGDNDASSRYHIVLAACDGEKDAEQCLRLTANLRAGMTDAEVGNIWIESSGAKGCDGRDTNRCWQ